MAEKCFYCNRVVKSGNSYANNGLHMDHVFPKSLFPELENFEMNIVACCADCNRRKSNMYPSHWFSKMQELYILEQDDIDRIGKYMSSIIFMAIKMGVIGVMEYPLILIGYEQWAATKLAARERKARERKNGTR